MSCRSLCVALTAAAALLLAGAAPTFASSAALGGLDVAGYCSGLGYAGVTLALGAITGPNYAYDNWACTDAKGASTVIAATGGAPSFTDMCHVQFAGVASYAAPTSADDAYSWNCYSLVPPVRRGAAGVEDAAVQTLLATDAVQAEIATLRADLAAHNYRQALRDWESFFAARSTHELIGDVFGGYGIAAPKNETKLKVQIGYVVFQ